MRRKENDSMAECRLVLASANGLHARPAAEFVRAAMAHKQAGVRVRVRIADGPSVDATSMLALLSLGAQAGDVVVLQADGAGAEQALDDLSALLTTDHDTVVLPADETVVLPADDTIGSANT